MLDLFGHDVIAEEDDVDVREEVGNAVRNRLPFEHANRHEYRWLVRHCETSPFRVTSRA